MRNNFYTEVLTIKWRSITRKSQRRLGSRFTKLRKDHARSKLRPFHVKIIVYRSLNLAFIEEEEEEEEDGGLADFRIAC